MDGIGTEITQKIKAAIKAKLIELGAYVDDELPDYIMVMVANKRSRSQMEDDLALFLNNNTKVFTVWLYSVLQKLQEVTVGTSKQASLISKSPPKETQKIKKITKKRKEKKTKKSKHKSKDKDKKHKKDDDKKKTTKKRKKGIKNTADEQVTKCGISNPMNVDEMNLEKKSVVETLVSDPVCDPDRPSGVVSMKLVDPEELQISNPEDLQLSNLDSHSLVDLSEEANSRNTQSSDPVISTQQEPLEVEIAVPTVKNLEEHNKENALEVIDDNQSTTVGSQGIITQKRRRTSGSSSSSMSAEEIRKQLLLSRAKKQLEQRNITSRMRSDSPEVIVIDHKTKPINRDSTSIPLSNINSTLSTNIQRRETEYKSQKLHPMDNNNDSDSDSSSASEKECNKKKISSQIVFCKDIEPAVPFSVAAKKPRELVPGDKQASKKLILKAVAAAERSVASAQPRKTYTDSKPKEIFTKNLREKRYLGIAITLENTDTQARKVRPAMENWENDSESDLSSLNKRSDRDFKKTQHSNTKYAKDIHSWLNDVEKAVEQEGGVEPIEENEQGHKRKKNGSNDWEEDSCDETDSVLKKKSKPSPVKLADPCIVVTMRGTNDKTVTAIRSGQESSQSFPNIDVTNTKISDRLAQPSSETDVNFSGKRISSTKIHKSDRPSIRSRLGKIPHEENSSLVVTRKCKFWPNCSKGVSCEYYHPTVLCRYLSNCKFKNQCMYVHPEDKTNYVKDQPHSQPAQQTKLSIELTDRDLRNRKQTSTLDSKSNSRLRSNDSECSKRDSRWDSTSSSSESPIVRV